MDKINFFKHATRSISNDRRINSFSLLAVDIYSEYNQFTRTISYLIIIRKFIKIVNKVDENWKIHI
jgi:hypothetical protein